jgi:asparagine synthase (glutamine-hydrolysing)
VCGIAGIAGFSSEKTSLLNKMLIAQDHRGPDATGLWEGESITLGHNRLSIIDLSPMANQPMVSNCGQIIIVLNGEIYNYKELKKQLPDYNYQTTSDTEVVIAAYKKWGKEMLQYLNGMFSFAIWDNNKKLLFAARDRFGVKPFYYSVSGGSLFFASEIKALWAGGISKERNLPVWAKYLVYGSYGLPDETFWAGVKQLPAGHYIEVSMVDGNAIREIMPVRWYDFVSGIETTPTLKMAELKEQYLYLLKESIKLRFRADVPVGFNISGGLDSSTLLALIDREYPDNSAIEAFTFYTGNPGYDELPWVENLISLTGKPLNKVLLKSSDVPDLVEKISYYEDEPFGGFPTLAYSLIFERAREKGIIVLLDGQGMDEAWAGYDYYHNNSGFTIQGTKTSPVRPEVLDPDFILLAQKEVFPEPFNDKLLNLQYRDIFYTKIPRALRFNDRISMMHSTELREPFLDYRLVELAFSQPKETKFKNGLSKWLLRDIVKDMLGENIALAPKRPLQTPQREWIAGELKEWCEESVNYFGTLNFVNPVKINNLWRNYQDGQNDNSFFIWQWINSACLTRHQ